jgi:hypothetical protein
VFLGTVPEAASMLKEGGMLENLNKEFSTSPETSDIFHEHPYGVRLQQAPSLYDFYLEVRARGACLAVL